MLSRAGRERERVEWMEYFNQANLEERPCSLGQERLVDGSCRFVPRPQGVHDDCETSARGSGCFQTSVTRNSFTMDLAILLHHQRQQIQEAL